jgi:dTDP-glucose 4,6-dehydratase
MVSTEVIPKFINLLQRGKPLFIHGNGRNTRRYLYAGDAADAFDTILHRGVMGQIYNVDSRDEVSNLDLAATLCRSFGIHDGVEQHVQYTRDRPFNDLRYAVDGSKLRGLGWTQQTSFEKGLATCVDWYGKFGSWWGDIENILTPFPEVDGNGEGRGRGANEGEVAEAKDVHSGAEVYDPAWSGVKMKTNGLNGGVNEGEGGGERKKTLKRKASVALEGE